MPLWAFILVLIIILLLIAAAVVIPVTLIVLPRQNAASPTNNSCKTSHTCHNGGTSIVINEKCQCVCSDGFTGSTCATAPDADCAGTTIPGPDTSTSYPNATVGNSIPRLLSAAGTNYSIPLSGWKLAAQFSNTNLSCTSENALITFNQQSQKQRRSLEDLLAPGPPQSQHRSLFRRFLSVIHPSPPPSSSNINNHNDDPTKTLTARSSAQSSNGIVFAPGSSPGSSSPGGSSSSSPSPSSTSNPSTSSSNTQSITPTTLDFARIAILFIFAETSDLGATTTAMTHLASLLGTGKVGSKFDPVQTSVGGNVTVDLEDLTVGFGNGTFFGGKGAH